MSEHIDKIDKKNAIIQTESDNWSGCCTGFPLENESFVRISSNTNIDTVLTYAHELGHAWDDTLYNKYGKNKEGIYNILVEYPSMFFELSFSDFINKYMVNDKCYYAINKSPLDLLKRQTNNTFKYSGKLMNSKSINIDYITSAQFYQMLYFIGTLFSLDTVDINNPIESFNKMKNIMIKDNYLPFDELLNEIDTKHALSVLEEKIENGKELQRKLYYK